MIEDLTYYIKVYKNSEEYRKYLGFDVFMRRLNGLQLYQQSCPNDCPCHAEGSKADQVAANYMRAVQKRV